MKTNKVLVIGVPLAALVIGLAWTFHHQQAKNEGRAKVAELTVNLTKAKESVLKDYAERLELVVSWEKELRAEMPQSLGSALKLNPTVLQSDKLDFDTQEAAMHFDLVQNQVSEFISSYIKLKPAAKQLHEIQKVEERLNRDRRAYHSIAFQIEDLDKSYRLHEAKPVIFQAERELKKYEESKR